MGRDEILWDMLNSRTSVRAFLPEALDQETIDTLFAMAQRAPSWCNIQPWRLTLTQPPVTDALRQELLAFAESTAAQEARPDVEFPSAYPKPYGDRRKECGVALYGAMAIAREDTAGRYDAWLRNYAIFDAPHLLVISRDRRLGEYGTLDVGVWLGTFLLAAESLGIHTCAMASIAAYPDFLRDTLNIPTEETILLGVAIGHADTTNKVNTLRTTRQKTATNLRICCRINPPNKQN